AMSPVRLAATAPSRRCGGGSARAWGISWMAVRPCSRCSERSSTAWIAYSPFAEIRTRSAHTFDLTGSLRHGSAHTAALEDARGLAGEVGDHDVGARPADGRERLHHGALLVEPAETPRGADHRVLARDRVGGQRHAELGLRARDDVEVRQGPPDPPPVRRPA